MMAASPPEGARAAAPAAAAAPCPHGGRCRARGRGRARGRHRGGADRARARRRRRGPHASRGGFPPRPLAPRAAMRAQMAKRWAELAGGGEGDMSVGYDPLARLSGSHREGPPQWRVHARQRTRRQYRSGLAIVARAVHRGRRTHRQRRKRTYRAGRADRAGGGRGALRGSHREPRRCDVRREIAEPARAPFATPRRARARRADPQGRAERRDRAPVGRRYRPHRHRQTAVGQGAHPVARPRDVLAKVFVVAQIGNSRSGRRRVAGFVGRRTRHEPRLARYGERGKDRGVANLAGRSVIGAA